MKFYMFKILIDTIITHVQAESILMLFYEISFGYWQNPHRHESIAELNHNHGIMGIGDDGRIAVVGIVGIRRFQSIA